MSEERETASFCAYVSCCSKIIIVDFWSVNAGSKKWTPHLSIYLDLVQIVEIVKVSAEGESVQRALASENPYKALPLLMQSDI